MNTTLSAALTARAGLGTECAQAVDAALARTRRARDHRDLAQTRNFIVGRVQSRAIFRNERAEDGTRSHQVQSHHIRQVLQLFGLFLLGLLPVQAVYGKCREIMIGGTYSPILGYDQHRVRSHHQARPRHAGTAHRTRSVPRGH